MISRARFANFKSLRDVGVDLQRLTLIVGANAAGKTSILQGLHDLLQTVSAPRETKRTIERTIGKPFSVFAGAHHPARIGGSAATRAFELECFGSPFECYGIRASIEKDAKQRFLAWRGADAGRRELPYGTPNAKDEVDFFTPLSVAGLGSVVYLNLDAKTAAQPHYSEEEEARVEWDGYGLPSVLQRLQLLRDGRFDAIEASLRKVVPAVQKLRAVPHRVRRPERMRVAVDGSNNWIEQVKERTGSRIEIEILGGGWIPGDLLSEGTVMTLALLTVLSDRAPRTMLLDDLDQSLHPAAQGRLMGELRSLMDAHPGLQLVATAHSPFIVDHAAVEEVRVVRLDDSGATRCQALGEHPKWAKRSGFMKPGEFWSGVGEDWVRG